MSVSRFAVLLSVVWLLCACGAAGPGDGYAGPVASPINGGAPVQIAGDAADPQPVAVDPAAVDKQPDGARGDSAAAPNQLAKTTTFPVFTDPGELPRLEVAEGTTRRGLPLEHTDVRARVTGMIAEVEVTQTYKNTLVAPIEVTYVFPLPDNAAVRAMKMTVGDRIVEAVVRERQAARRAYEDAKRQGHVAALLEQERSNVFTQSIANVEPGKKIDVTIRYLQDLTYDSGRYELVFPMVVGPRFVQPGLVADGARITPPALAAGERSGHDVSLRVTLEGITPIGDVEVLAHETATRAVPGGGVEVALVDKSTIANRDFVMRWRVAGEKPRATLLLSGRNDGYATLVVHPPTLDVDGLVGRRELVFVVDVSGSMAGTPLALCKRAMREALVRLRPVDTFNVITFAGATGKVFERPRHATDANIRAALGFVDQQRAGGGTRMLDAVAAALTPDVSDGRHRYVFFLTDGYVGIEDQIVSSTRRFVGAIEGRGQRAKVFGFGVGSSPNRALIEGLSREGKGVAVYASNREDPLRGVNRFFRYVDSSVLRDVRVDWGGLAVADPSPLELPDLFASHALVVHGRFHGSPERPPVLRASSAAGPIEIPVTVSAAPEAGRDVLGALWARARIGELDADFASGRREAQAEITKLAIDHHLVSRFTSLVAIDRSRVVSDGRPRSVTQPVEVPEDVDGAMAGAQLGQTTSGVGRETEITVDVGKSSNAPPPSPEAGGEFARADRGPRGCGCRVGAEGEAGNAGVLAALVLLLTAMRRRRAQSGTPRAQSCSPRPPDA